MTGQDAGHLDKAASGVPRPGEPVRLGGRSSRPQPASSPSASRRGSWPRPGSWPGDGWVVPATVLPVADLLGLVLAILATASAGLPSTVYALAVLAILAMGGQHRLRICLRVCDQAGRILTAVALPLLVLLPWMPAGSAARLALWSAGLVIGFRIAVCAALRVARRRGLLTEPALVIGAGTFGAHIGDLMSAHPELGLQPKGYLDSGAPRRDLALPTLGVPADLAEVVTRLHIRRVIVCYAACKDEDLVTVLRASRPLGADVCVVPRLYEVGAAVPRHCIDEIWGIPLIPLRRFDRPSPSRYLKRILDAGAAAVLLAVASPLLLVLAGAIRLQSGQAPLFRQTRVTGNGRTAVILKLRTLSDHPGDPDTSWNAPVQPGNALGRWLRASHLDELPQLVNVLRGEMSLVGPRPERPYFAQRFGREIPRYSDRTRMPAGMTGWAQVHGLHGDTSMFERARFDNQYIEYWSPWLDAVILARTLTTTVLASLGGKP
jgi:exopolysaccharide biosynthesis polyprenyl glycosylphosphotransferase